MKKIYLISTVLAIITGIVVFLYASEFRKSSQEQKQTNMVSVVVAASDITENSAVTAELLTTSLYPPESVPENAITNPDIIIGKIVKTQISKGEQILTSKILTLGDNKNGELSERIQQGYRAFTISVDEVSGIAGYLRIGDMVDIIITKQVDDKSITQYCLQNIAVIAVGNSAQNNAVNSNVIDYGNITLEVSAEDCIKLNHSIINGLVKIVLRGYGDDIIIDTPAISK